MSVKTDKKYNINTSLNIDNQIMVTYGKLSEGEPCIHKTGLWCLVVGWFVGKKKRGSGVGWFVGKKKSGWFVGKKKAGVVFVECW